VPERTWATRVTQLGHRQHEPEAPPRAHPKDGVLAIHAFSRRIRDSRFAEQAHAVDHAAQG
jgi:hypothetical protein